MCVKASLSQDGFYRTGVWVEHPLTSPPPLISSEPFCAHVVREVYWLWEWEICGLGKVHSTPPPPSCPAILVLEFWSIQNESPIALPWVGEVAGDISLSASRPQGGWELTVSQWPQSQSWRSVWAAIPWFSCTSPLQQDGTDFFLGNRAPRVTVSKQKCLSNLCLLQTCWCLISQHKPHGQSRVYVEEYHMGTPILRHLTLWG